MWFAVAFRTPRSATTRAPANPSVSVLSTGVPDITVDSILRWTRRRRASARRSSAPAAHAALLEVITEEPRSRASRMWLRAGSGSRGFVLLASARTSHAVSVKPARAVAHHRALG